MKQVSFHKVYGHSARWYAHGMEGPSEIRFLSGYDPAINGGDFSCIMETTPGRIILHSEPTPQLSLPDLFKTMRQLVDSHRIAFDMPRSVREELRQLEVAHAALAEVNRRNMDETAASVAHIEALNDEVEDEVEDPRTKIAAIRLEELTGSSNERADEDDRPKRKYWSREQAINYLKVVGLYDFLPECYK